MAERQAGIVRRLVVPALFVGALFAVYFLRRPEPTEPGRHLYTFTGQSMGTSWHAKVVAGPLPADDVARMEAAVVEALDAVDRRMSTYREDSELSRFNRHGTAPFEASAELVEVMAEARRVSELTDGAFDVTVGPLVKAWGFGPGRHSEPPTQEAIDALRAQSGYRRITVDRERRLLTKEIAAVQADLSAIAKGHAADRAAAALEALGRTEYMVEVGGEIRARGRNQQGRYWQIGVEKPMDESRELQEVVALVDAGMATSGDYRNYYEKDGVRFSHTLDPRTGRPITHRLASVTVVHPSAATADALATALTVLGPEDGPALAEARDLQALFIIRRADGGFDVRATPAFEALRGASRAEEAAQ